MPQNTIQQSDSKEKGISVTIIIQGGNNQILPTATHVTQHFYGVKPEAPVAAGGADVVGGVVVAGGAVAQQEVSPEALSQLRKYITDGDVLNRYLSRLATCCKARELAFVIVDMAGDIDVKVDREEMVKQRFLEVVLPLASKVTSSISNLRQQVNSVWAKRKLRRKV